MNIIFVSNNMAKARTLTLAQALLLLVAVIGLSVVLTLAFILPQADGKHQGVKTLLPNSLNFSLHNPQEHLDALALQLGELQARVMRLDALSDRLSKLAGVKEKSVAEEPAPGRGGPEINAEGMTEAQLQHPHPGVRSAAAAAIASLKTPADQLPLASGVLKDKDLAVRVPAARLAPPPLPWLRETEWPRRLRPSKRSSSRSSTSARTPKAGRSSRPSTC